VRNLEFDFSAFEDLAWWIGIDKKIAMKIMRVIEEIHREPFKGMGKPEPLKHQLSGCWSRRINDEHRIIYQVYDDKIRILACRYHYD
jgi:toxin YoeB